MIFCNNQVVTCDIFYCCSFGHVRLIGSSKQMNTSPLNLQDPSSILGNTPKTGYQAATVFVICR